MGSMTSLETKIKKLFDEIMEEQIISKPEARDRVLSLLKQSRKDIENADFCCEACKRTALKILGGDD